MKDTSDLWIGKDPDGTVAMFDSEPTLSRAGELLCDGDCVLVRDFPFIASSIPPGHKAKLTIGEPIDCRPKPVPELWAIKYGDGFTCIGEKDGQWVKVVNDIPELPRSSRCRIAFDEQGIRLIGEPVGEPVPI